MMSVREVPEPGTFDVFEESLLLPVPAPEKNNIVLEARDGNDVRRLSSKQVTLYEDGTKSAGVDEVLADVIITDARLAYACSKYTKGGGWMGFGGGGAVVVALALNAGSKALAAHRRHGKMLVGHVRYPWLSAVGSTSKFGWLSDEELHLVTEASGVSVRLAIVLPKNTDAAEVAAEITRRAAMFRLASEVDLTPEKRAEYEKLAEAKRIEPEKGKIQYHLMPDYWPVSDKSARMMPSVELERQAQPALATAAPTPETCPSCGIALPRPMAFCVHCGTALSSVNEVMQ